MAGQHSHLGPAGGGVRDHQRAATELGDRGAVVCDLDRRQRGGEIHHLLDLGQGTGAQPAHPDRVGGLEVGREHSGPTRSPLKTQGLERLGVTDLWSAIRSGAAAVITVASSVTFSS